MIFYCKAYGIVMLYGEYEINCFSMDPLRQLVTLYMCLCIYKILNYALKYLLLQDGKCYSFHFTYNQLFDKNKVQKKKDMKLVLLAMYAF